MATGYHAIEFLLWGQDLNGTGPGAGARPASDFDPANCSWGNCDRRAAYLQTATDLLIDDLEWITAQWAPSGEAREGLVGGDVGQGLATIFTGMGSLSYGELAGERMQLGLLLHDPEEEHDCFSDNTHASHYYDALGIRNIYLGTYERIDGSAVRGPSVSDLVAAASPDADAALRARLDDTMAAMGEIVAAAEGGEAYDQQIGEGNPDGQRAGSGGDRCADGADGRDRGRGRGAQPCRDRTSRARTSSTTPRPCSSKPFPRRSAEQSSTADRGRPARPPAGRPSSRCIRHRHRRRAHRLGDGRIARQRTYAPWCELCGRLIAYVGGRARRSRPLPCSGREPERSLQPP